MTSVEGLDVAVKKSGGCRGEEQSQGPPPNSPFSQTTLREEKAVEGSFVVGRAQLT